MFEHQRESVIRVACEVALAVSCAAAATADDEALAFTSVAGPRRYTQLDHRL